MRICDIDDGFPPPPPTGIFSPRELLGAAAPGARAAGPRGAESGEERERIMSDLTPEEGAASDRWTAWGWRDAIELHAETGECAHGLIDAI